MKVDKTEQHIKESRKQRERQRRADRYMKYAARRAA